MKYRVPHFFPAAISIVIIGGCFALLMKTTFTKNKQSYKELLYSLQILEEDQDTSAKQKKRGVRKEIWYAKNGQRLMILAQAKSSDVYLENINGRSSIIERMEDVTAIVQEDCNDRVDPPLQKLKRIQAESASYNYSNQSLIAQDVIVEEFVVHGNHIPKQLPPPLHTLRTQEVELKFETGNLRVDANKVMGVSRE